VRATTRAYDAASLGRQPFPDELREEVWVTVDGRHEKGYRFVPRGSRVRDLNYTRLAEEFASLPWGEQWVTELTLVDLATRDRYYDPVAFAQAEIQALHIEAERLAEARARRTSVEHSSSSDRVRFEMGIHHGPYAAVEVPRMSINPIVYGAGVTTGALIFGAAFAPAVVAGVFAGILLGANAAPRQAPRRPPPPRQMRA
jgi:hypothetical protein